MSIKSTCLSSVIVSLAFTVLAGCSDASDKLDDAAGAAVGAAQNAAQDLGMGAPMGMGADAMGPPAGGMGPPPNESSNLIPSSKITYKTVEGKDLQLHIFNPEGHKAGDKRAALVFYPGGGFRSANPQSGYDLSEVLNPKGVVVISAEYRITDTEGRTLDHIISDAKSSVRYMRAHADELGIDPNKIVSSGHSAGAYLGAANGMIDEFDQPGEDTSISAMSNAMVLWSMGAQRSERNTGQILGQGHTLEDYQLRKFLDSDLPPSLFIHGDQDDIINHVPTLAFMEDVKAAGNQTDFVLIEGANHFFRDEGQRTQAKVAIVEFLESLGFTAP